MIKTFCDRCGKEIVAGANLHRLEVSFIGEGGKDSYFIKSSL